ncbi:rhodanese-like domain-containing protein [Undibacterium fentianense]|uniref:Rhodanese-like domain-containing protein n=1 Tax=Undibacterium fentianense TaxID=2828728 RepID=A0A941IH56_9BURK|nr:rhodanese-like domain-containing protein [Undibacterium fentianense]MBR7800655.1 rhodanese-like domain-containing protein [Undibacterium fentianense]
MTTNAVLEVAAATSADAFQRFASSLQYETDCWDVHEAFTLGDPGFVLFDVRNQDEFQGGHIGGAIHMMRGKMIASKLAVYPANTLFVVYCAGPHCNGATKAAMVLAKLGRPVKVMLGGITGWLDQGYPLTKSVDPSIIR